MREALVVRLGSKGKGLRLVRARNACGMWRKGGTVTAATPLVHHHMEGRPIMQQQTPSGTKPMTVRGDDGKPHLLSDMKPEPSPAAPQPRIRPIVPRIFGAPD